VPLGVITAAVLTYSINKKKEMKKIASTLLHLLLRNQLITFLIKSIEIKTVCYILFAFVFFICCTQNRSIPEKDIYGSWKCINGFPWKASKYDQEEIDKIKSSILVIENGKFYFDKISFIETCTFEKIKISKYDTLYNVPNLRLLYTSKELSVFSAIDLLDKNGEISCYNDCAQLFYKQDTLINICGGYTLIFVKDAEKTKSSSKNRR
jgi:hypothetical protein